MLGFWRSPLEIDAPKGDSELLRSSCRRQSYLQRLGVQFPAAAQMAELDDSRSTTSTETMSTASTESGVFPPLEAHGDIRQKFLRKLAYSKVWVPQVHRSPKHQTIVIFDWDDTLLCTTWLRENDFQPGDDGEYEERLRSIVQHSKNLLETAVKAGRTFIITNAVSGWVELSAARWAPDLLPVLRKVRVISARDRFEASFPGDVMQWKIQAFLEVQRQLDATPITNLVALGDADYEMEAARIMGEQFEEGLVKTVKFRPNPNPEEHRLQLALVDTKLEKIIGSVKNMKVRLERKM